MLKHIGHLHHGKLHTFDDFYRDNSKPIKSRSSSGDLSSGSNSLPTSPCSPTSNSYTFYNIFSDFKSSNTPDVVPEEDETETEVEEIKIEPAESTPPTALFYLEDDHHNQTQPSSSPSSSSPHWSSLILNRFRHGNHHHGIVKQNSVNENQMHLNKLRKSDSTDSAVSKHRFLKRSETINHTDGLAGKKSSADDFPELSLPNNNNNNNAVKKHRSFVSLLHHFHPNSHHHHHQQHATKKRPDRSNSTGTLDFADVHSNPQEFARPKLNRQRTVPVSSDEPSPVKKAPTTPMLPKLTSLFHRHHLSEQHKHRVGNLRARLHHRRNSPPLTSTAPKFQCQVSNELIEEIKQLEEQQYIDDDNMLYRRPAKPVVMKRVHTWHNSFDLRPVEQCLEY